MGGLADRYLQSLLGGLATVVREDVPRKGSIARVPQWKPCHRYQKEDCVSDIECEFIDPFYCMPISLGLDGAD